MADEKVTQQSQASHDSVSSAEKVTLEQVSADLAKLTKLVEKMAKALSV